MTNLNSRIFWHFTGSPGGVEWGQIKYPKEIIKNKKPKSPLDSFEIVKKIFNNKSLLAKCVEKVYGNRKTEKFCCVTDIPINHLNKHKEFYGEVAIGFNSNKIYKKFNPVLYIPKADIIKNAIEVIETIENVKIEELGLDPETAIRSEFTDNKDGTWAMPSTIIQYAKNSPLEKYLLNHLKITSFSDEPDQSFYQEKEWRKIGNFDFEHDDVEAIIVPKSLINESISFLNSIRLTNISIISWDIISKS